MHRNVIFCIMSGSGRNEANFTYSLVYKIKICFINVYKKRSFKKLKSNFLCYVRNQNNRHHPHKLYAWMATCPRPLVPGSRPDIIRVGGVSHICGCDTLLNCNLGLGNDLKSLIRTESGGVAGTNQLSDDLDKNAVQSPPLAARPAGPPGIIPIYLQ